LRGSLTGTPCVWYRWQVQEQFTETAEERYTDEQGHTRTRTREVTRWATVANGGESAPFYLKDDTGVVRIVPERATIEGALILQQTCTPAGPLYFQKGPSEEVPHSDRRRTFTETAIPLHATLYVSLKDLRQRVQQARSQVDVQLQWRSDLIPDLVQVVEAFRSHESRVQGLVAELRGQTAVTLQGGAAKGVAPAVAAVSERYPELKANELFLKLQQRLTEAEQRIALARDYFNQIGTFYNIRLLIIRDRFVAALGGLRLEPPIAASDFERAQVQVKLVD